jgi:acyl carrier protein
MLREMNMVREAVLEEVRLLLAARGGGQVGLDGERRLSDLGLDSLGFAELVVQLEARLGVDPFASLVGIADVRTVDDLVAAYGMASQGRLEAAG